MSFIVSEDVCIHILEGSPPPIGTPSVEGKMTKEQARTNLKAFTGVDFGYDTVAWRKWFRENKPEIVSWFTMSNDEMDIAIIEERPSMLIIGFEIAKGEARQRLINLTGQDFGYDGEAWRQWYRENRSDLAKRFVYG